jgi:GTP-binding protein HflX
LTEADSYARDEYFSTLDTTTRKLETGLNIDVILTDTVGFISKLPHHIMETFNATMEEVSESYLIIILLDGASRYIFEKYKIVRDVLARLNADEVPVLNVLNKIDVMTNDKIRRVEKEIPEVLKISALKGKGLLKLKDKMKEASLKGWKKVKVRIDISKDYFVKWLERNSHIINRTYYKDEIEIECLIRREYLKNLYDEEKILSIME